MPALQELTGNHLVLRVTLDTNQLDDSTVDGLRVSVAGCSVLVDFATVTVNERELGRPAGLPAVVETAVWDESAWDTSVWGGAIPEVFVLDETPLGQGVLGGEDSVLEQALGIVSNGSFPRPSLRGQLSRGHLRLLRDAMTFEAHVRHRRHVLVSADGDLTGPTTRPQLERLGRTRLMPPGEFRTHAARNGLADLLMAPE